MDAQSQIDYRHTPSAAPSEPAESCPDYDHPIPAPEFHQPPPQDVQTEPDYDQHVEHNQMQLGIEIPVKGWSPDMETLLAWERGDHPR